MTFRTAIFCISALGLVTASAAFADSMGGGGGGSMGGGDFTSNSAPKVDPVKRYAEGAAALDAKNYREAQRAFREVLTVQRNDGPTNYMMGLSLVSDNKAKDSRSYFERAVKANADFAIARGWLGYAYVKSGQADKATEQKTALEALKVKCAASCKDASDIEAAIKRIDDAIANPTAALTPIAPKLAAADGQAAYLSASGLINQGRYAEALIDLRQAALAVGPHADVLTYQGFANRKLGNLSTALGYYSAALKIEPNHRGANEYLGEYYVEIGDMPRARAQLAKLETICKFGCEQAYELRRWIEGKRS